MKQRKLVRDNAPKRRTSVVESKFKKRKKQRSKGFYSSSLAQRNIKFIGEINVKKNISRQDVTCNTTAHPVVVNCKDEALNSSEQETLICAAEDKLSSSTEETLNINCLEDTLSTGSKKVRDPLDLLIVPNQNIAFWDLDARECELLENFCSSLRRSSLPAIKNFTSVAVITKSSHKLTWLDLESLNTAPSNDIFRAMQHHFGKTEPGWLTKFLVDAYVGVVIARGNRITVSEMFGFLDIDNSMNVVEERGIGNIEKFSISILSSQQQTLRNHIFLPLLINQHFVFYWFDKKSKLPTLVDSISQDRSHMMSLTLEPIKKFLSNFDVSYSQIKFQEMVIVLQPDSRSCGICLCMAVDKICFNCSSSNIEKKVEGIEVEDIPRFRSWIPYALFAASVMYSPEFKVAGEMLVVNNTLGLPNLINNCWFNALLQAVAFVMKSFSVSFQSIDLNKYSKRYSNLCIILANIIDCPCKEIDKEYLIDVIQNECKKCCFLFGQQEDPEEFFALSKLPLILSSFNISCLVQWTEVHCYSCCGHEAVQESLQACDLRLPIFNSNKDLGSLKECLESFLAEKQDKQLICGECQKSSPPVLKKKINALGRVMVLCLSRNIGNHKNSKNVLANKALAIKNETESLIVDYELKAVIVHLGDNAAKGHFVTYIFHNKSLVLKIDDKKIELLDYESEKHIIETCGYMFFYIKNGDRCLVSNRLDESSESDGNVKRRRGIRKKVLKRRHKPLDCNLRDSKESRECIWVSPKTMYFSKDKFGTVWQKENQSKLDVIVDSLSKLAKMSVSECKCNVQFFRHSLFINARHSDLERITYRTQIETCYKFAFDLESYIIQKLCWEKAIVRLIENTVVSGPTLVRTFQFKKSVIGENCELTHYLDFKYAGACNSYITEVLSVEGLILFFMLSEDKDYISTSKCLNIPIPTAYTPIPAAPIIAKKNKK